MTFTINLHTTTPGNGRRHWRADWAAAKAQRKCAKLATLFHARKDRGNTLPRFPVRVVLTRIGPRAMDRHNLPGALKHVIDGLADAYGIDDGHDGWDFIFGQQRGKQHQVKIEIESKAPIE